ncbi:MAG TPA: hypothetical protein VFQ70_03660, partial [Candidatus Saccharimonadaceae bacterium]|nr:hypothetical protein [Candidatus Saccharimonadaceae bacterium]
NTFHDLTVKPVMPSYEVMADCTASHQLASQALKRLVESAQDVMVGRALFPMRRRTVANGGVVPFDDEDSIGEAILREQFAKDFTKYSAAVDECWDARELPPLYADALTLVDKRRPATVLRHLGSLATMSHINLIPIIAA